jgi:hypothetical protein
VAAAEQLGQNGRTDKTGGANECDVHEKLLKMEEVPSLIASQASE